MAIPSIGVEATAREVYLRTHVEALENVANKLDNANGGLQRLADRLFGGQPTDDSDSAATPVPEGLVGECKERVEVLSRLADQINSALSRLEQIA